jgi:hypothetical protein
MDIIKIAVVTAGVSLTFILAILSYYKLKEQDVSSKTKEIESYVNFENEVSSAIERLGKYNIVAGDSTTPYDFAIINNGENVFIEVKSWNRRVPAQILGRIVERLNQSVIQYRAKEAIIVTPTLLYPSSSQKQAQYVKIMSLKELRNYLAHTV